MAGFGAGYARAGVIVDCAFPAFETGVKRAVKIGLHLPVMVPGLDRDAILTWSRRIDQGPFSSLASGERITFPNPDITVALSAAAAVTERVQLHYSVLVTHTDHG